MKLLRSFFAIFFASLITIVPYGTVFAQGNNSQNLTSINNITTVGAAAITSCTGPFGEGVSNFFSSGGLSSIIAARKLTRKIKDKEEELEKTLDAEVDDALAVPTDSAGVKAQLEVLRAEQKKRLDQMNDKEGCFDALAYASAKVLVNTAVNKFFSWANSAMGGRPLFLTDPDAFFMQLRNTEWTKMYQELDAAYGDIAYSVGYGTGAEADYYRRQDQRTVLALARSQRSLASKLKPTLSPDTIERFGEDFKEGGWGVWNKYAEPQNNPIGRADIIEDTFHSRVANSIGKANRELSQGDGFLSVKRCVDPEDAPTFQGGQFQDSYGVTVFTEDIYNPNCKKWENSTPGKMVSEAVTASLLSELKTSQEADEANEVVALILSTVMSALIGEGADSGLAGW